jgi:endoglucanase Acf2
MHDEEMIYAEKLSLNQRQVSMDRTVQEEQSGTIEMEALPDPDDFCVRILEDNYNDESVAERSSQQRCPSRRKLYLWISLVVIFLIVVISPSAAIANRKSTAQAIGGDDNTTLDDTDSDPPVPTDWDFSTRPFSTLDPTTKLYNFIRPAESSPSARLDPLRLEQEANSTQRESNDRPLPTSAWYQNLLMLGEQEEPSTTHRAYAMPYVVDVIGNIPGLRIHTFQKVTTYDTVNLNIDEPHALTLGAALDLRQQQSIQQLFGAPKGYSVQAATQLGVSLKWDYFPMTSSIVKGMPYATMEYAPRVDQNEADLTILPTIYSDVPLFGALAVDGVTSINCDGDLQFGVEREAQLLFQSGITWMVFFSRPTQLQCKNDGGRFVLQAVEDFNIKDPLVIRVAMVVPRDNKDQNKEEFASRYKEFLRRHSNVYPGANTRVAQAVSDDKVYGNLVLDWDAQTMRKDDADANGDLAMFALPHHQDKLKKDVQEDLCTVSLLGPLCPILGASWSMVEMLPEVSFQAPRHPDPSMLPALAESLRTDILYQIPANFQLGAGDTYFSGKALGKLARILLINEEVNEICQDPSEEYREVCVDALLQMPVEVEVTMALEHLRKGVEIWLHGEGQSPFVYDPAWGGVVNCGCMYSYGKCLNKIPDCPAFTDKLLNFGGGFYSDHHFHYGYHVYAAATVGHFDHEWGRQNFEDVLLLVRDFANPSPADASFPLFRHKDWYQGHSWA